MGNELQKLSDEQKNWLAEQNINEDTWLALQSSLFPGANPASVQMYWHYCQARKLDPMKKPAHIVPMRVKDARTNEYKWRDVIMPGIAEARITANRTGQYAGQDEPEFGPDMEFDIGGAKITAPSYCTVRVHRIIGHRVATFAHTEYYDEACATDRNGQPNSMWKKRKRGQLAKCAEAGALRKAFPEELGGEIMADEHKGDEHTIEVAGPEKGRSSAAEALGSLAEPKQGEVVDAEWPQEPAEDATVDDQDEPATEAGVEGSTPQQPSEGDTSDSAQANTAPLFDSSGNKASEYKRQGDWLNALTALIDDAADGNAVQYLMDWNADVLDHICASGAKADKVAELKRKAAERMQDQPAGEHDDWLADHEAGTE